MQRGQIGTPQASVPAPVPSAVGLETGRPAATATPAAKIAPLQSPELAAAFEQKRMELAKTLQGKAASMPLHRYHPTPRPL